MSNYNLTINSDNAEGFFKNQSLKDYIDGLLSEVNDAGVPGVLKIDFMLSDSMRARKDNSLLNLEIPLVPYTLDETNEDEMRLIDDNKKIKSKNEYIEYLKSSKTLNEEDKKLLSTSQKNFNLASKRICDYIKGELAIKYLEAKEILNIASKGKADREITSDEANAQKIVKYIKSLDVIDFELDNVKVNIPNTREYFGGHTSPKELRENIKEFIEEEILKSQLKKILLTDTIYIMTDGNNRYIFNFLGDKNKTQNIQTGDKQSLEQNLKFSHVDFVTGKDNMDYKANILPKNLESVINLQNQNSFGS